jgi:predicted ATPase/DNA-binding winged helix-turn-helix (wHTH) protein
LRKSYEIGPFRLDADLGVLTRAGTPVALGARPVAVLAVLVEHAHEFLSKERLIDAAWPGVIVEESNLPVQVHAIRRALAGVPGAERWIETLPKRGYRFVGPMRAAGDVGSEASERARSNLPEAQTSFIGRERDLVEIKRLLAAKRLITIVGIGGIGKTRLALQAAAEVVGAYRDGAWLADLAPLRDAASVPAAVAQALGVAEQAGKPFTTALCAHLRPLQTLLVLDNCEHLLDACAALVDALQRETAQTTVVATSREPIRVSGEQVYSLQPLSLPQPGSSIDALQRSEAAQLLFERVRQQLPEFELTDNRAPAIAELCIHLDGIPLALELAAARTRSMSIEQINARLGDRFRVLTGGARAALPRQQTLRATFDWSYDLLPEDERVVLRRLAVFAGSFSVQAACAVASDTQIDEFAVVDLLSQLVTRSLVNADTSGSSTRYRLLETTQAYAQEKLVEAAEIVETARRHAAFFRTFFERAPDDFLRLPDASLREIYVPEIDHLRAALDWSFGPDGDAAIGIPLAGASGPLWGMLGLFGEGARRLEAAIARVNAETPPLQQAMLWRQFGRLVDETPARSLPAFERAASLYRAIDDRQGLAHTLAQLGRALAYLGKLEASQAALDEANSLLAQIDVPWLHALYFFHMGFLKNRQRDLMGARNCYERARALFQRAGDDFTAAAAAVNAALITWTLGDVEAAEATFRQHVALMRSSPMRTRRMLGWSLANLAGVLTERGALEEAFAAAREGLPLLLEEASAWPFVSHLALHAALVGRLSDAARLAGYSDCVWSKQHATPHPVDARTTERLRSILADALSPAEVARLRAEGAELTEAEACALALANEDVAVLACRRPG